MAVVVYMADPQDMVRITVSKDDAFWSSNKEKIERFALMFVKYLVYKNIETY